MSRATPVRRYGSAVCDLLSELENFGEVIDPSQEGIDRILARLESEPPEEFFKAPQELAYRLLNKFNSKWRSELLKITVRKMSNSRNRQWLDYGSRLLFASTWYFGKTDECQFAGNMPPIEFTMDLKTWQIHEIAQQERKKIFNQIIEDLFIKHDDVYCDFRFLNFLSATWSNYCGHSKDEEKHETLRKIIIFCGKEPIFHLIGLAEAGYFEKIDELRALKQQIPDLQKSSDKSIKRYLRAKRYKQEAERLKLIVEPLKERIECQLAEMIFPRQQINRLLEWYGANRDSLPPDFPGFVRTSGLRPDRSLLGLGVPRVGLGRASSGSFRHLMNELAPPQFKALCEEEGGPPCLDEWQARIDVEVEENAELKAKLKELQRKFDKFDPEKLRAKYEVLKKRSGVPTPEPAPPVDLARLRAELRPGLKAELKVELRPELKREITSEVEGELKATWTRTIFEPSKRSWDVATAENLRKQKEAWEREVVKPLRERVDSLEEVERQATSIRERLRRHLEKTASIHVNSGATLRDLFTWCEEKIIEPASSAVEQMAQWEINVAPAMCRQVTETINQLRQIPNFPQQLGEMLRELHPVYQTLVNKAV